MAALRTASKSIALKNVLITRIPVISTTRLYWTKDWKPGPYPRTPEERAKAAKKYGLLPEDYEPYPDDGLGCGDYPKLPIVSADARDPFIDWDYQRDRRNFGEPVHADADSHGPDRLNLNEVYYPTRRFKFFGFVTTMIVWVALCILGEKYRYQHPVMPKQLYQEGVDHYTFDEDDSPPPMPEKKRGFF